MSDVPVDPSIEPGIKPPKAKSPRPDLVPDEELFDRKKVGSDDDFVDVEVDDDLDIPAHLLRDQPDPMSDEMRYDMREMIYIGKAEEEVDICGHTVIVQTLQSESELFVGRYTKEYKGTDFYARAYQIAFCAVGVKSIDGRPIVPSPLSPEDDGYSYFKAKADKLVKYYPVTVAKMYDAVTELEKKTAAKIDSLVKSDG